MTQIDIPWRRFWVPTEGKVRLASDGFLEDPESEWGELLNPDVQPVNLLADAPCVVLLGEPGSGKSSTLEVARHDIEARLSQLGTGLIWLDLHEIGSDFQLARRLFDRPAFQDWKRGEGELSLFLDSLDECRLQIKALPGTLISEIREGPVDRLRLRLACRTAEWPASLERGLRGLWEEDEVQVFELAPLRKADVRLAADTFGIESASFLSAVDQVNAVPLAIKPLTLNFLLRSFEDRGSLPTSQAELYRAGCLRLCEESLERHEHQVQRFLSAEQRLAVAERIAALTIFANRAAILIRPAPDEQFPDDLLIRELSGVEESTRGEEFAVGEQSVQEALNTGLFSARGTDRLGWAHRTYEEFLAATFAVKHELALQQIMSLLVHSDDPEGKLVPQLFGVASWLAGMRHDVFREVLRSDPEILASSDLSSLSDDDRADLVSALLQASEKEGWVDQDWQMKRHFKKLSHMGISDQLRPYIIDATKGPYCRRVAIHIAEEAEVSNLIGDLVSLALDPETPVHIRVYAAYAVIRLGGVDSRSSLRALIELSSEEDPDAQLKGCGLLATWPGHLPTADLLKALTRSSSNLFGTYRRFLHDDPVKDIPVEELPLGLGWVYDQLPLARPDELEEVVEGILRRAWDYLDDPEIRGAFGRVVWKRADDADPVFSGRSEDLFGDTDKRRRALVGAVEVAQSTADFWQLRYSGLVGRSDAQWLLSQYLDRAEEEKERWGELLQYALSWDDLEALDAAWLAAEADPRLAALLGPVFDPILIDSDLAKRLREDYRRWALRAARSQERSQTSVQTRRVSQLESLLEQIKAGDLAAWWKLTVELGYESEDYGTIDEWV